MRLCISRESIGTRVGHRSLLLRSVRAAVESPRTCYAHYTLVSLSYTNHLRWRRGGGGMRRKVRVWRCASALAVGGGVWAAPKPFGPTAEFELGDTVEIN